MPTVQGKVLKPDGTPDTGAKVWLELVGADPEIGFVGSADFEITGRRLLRPDTAGVWSAASVYANASISPAGTVYGVTVSFGDGGVETYYIDVPASPSSVWAGDYLTSAPDGTNTFGTHGGPYVSASSIVVHSSVQGDAYDEMQLLADGSFLTGDGTVAPVDRFDGLRWVGRIDLSKAQPAVMSSPPTISVANRGAPSTTISGGVNVPAIGVSGPLTGLPNTTNFTFGGALWRQLGSSYPNTLYAAPYVPSLTEEPLYPPVDFDYYGTEFEFGYKGQGVLESRVWVDGEPAEAVYTDPFIQDGAWNLRKVTFATAGWRRIRLELATQKFWGLNVGPNDYVSAVESGRQKLLIIHDSYGEGTGATRFDGYAPQVGRMLGFDDLINLSQGSTGILAANVGLGRPKYRDRAGDWTGLGATAALVGLSINDSQPATQPLLDELALLLPIVKAVPGIRDVWVIGVAARAGGNVAAAQAFDAACAPVVTALGIPFISLVTPNPLWTGTGGAQNPTGSGTSDVFYNNSGGLGSHPTQAGHTAIAKRFVSGLIPYLQASH